MSDEQPEVGRRAMLGGVATVGAAMALGPFERAEAKQAGRAPRSADVIVVGAGAAGSAAAYAIHKAGRSVLLLEARDRVGGRTLNHSLGTKYPGKVSEIGGTFIGPTQTRMYELVHELGLKTFPTYDTGHTVGVINGKRSTFTNSNPLSYIKLNTLGGTDALTTFLSMERLSKQVPVEAPWTAAKAEEWDSLTLDSWTRQNMLTSAGRHMFDTLTSAVWGCQNRDISFLWALYYIAAAGNETTPGNLTRLTATTGGAQQDRIVGGSQLIWIKIAERLGSRVVLNAPVDHISQAGNTVTVHSPRGEFRGKRVIIAMPPALTSRIRYAPDLPPLRDQLVQRFPQGSYAKVEAVYDRPFWRENGSNGQAFGDNGVVLTFDSSPPDGSPGVMAGFIGGDAARQWDRMGDGARKDFVLRAFAEYFGPGMLKPRDYFEARWTHDLWSRGGPTGFTPPGVLTGFHEALRDPVGRIHWAGTETSDYWPGYMEGAVRSGQRAAKEALAHL